MYLKINIKKLLPILILSTSIFACNTQNDDSPMSLAKEKTAPFEKFDYKDNKVFVLVDNEEFQLLKIDTTDVSYLVDIFKQNYGLKWEKIFAEDIVEYLNQLEIYPKQVEAFTLLDRNGGTVLKKIKFNRKKREAAKTYYEETYKKAVDPNAFISIKEAVEDLEQLKEIIQNRYSYAFLNSVDVQKEINKIKAKIKKDITTYELALYTQQFLNKFGDGHSRVDDINFNEKGVLPFSVLSFDKKILCFRDGELLHNNFPFLKAINDVPISQLLNISEDYFTANASPQFIQMVSVSRLSRIGEILNIAGKYDEKLTVTLMSDEGETFIIEEPIKEIIDSDNLSFNKKLKLLNYNPFEIKFYDDIGYLKIEKMHPLLGELEDKLNLKKLSKSKALIIDVRNNGGGSRHILTQLAPYFIKEKQQFVIGNVSRLRTNNPIRKYKLNDRFLYQIDDKYFSETVKNRIESWTNTFTPSIELNDTQYTPNYYLYIERNDNPIFSDISTVVLMNEGCYSATDIFLSAFKEIEGVTLIGTPSGGGSGRAMKHRLSNSRIVVKLSSIVSLKPNGELYDGIGVIPDIVVKQQSISDMLKQTDNQLDFALNFLSENQ